jgi:uncharacterized protein (TIRG00374 family)
MFYLAAQDIRFDETWEALRQADWIWLLPFFACMAAQHLFRAWRWSYLLAPIEQVPFRRILPISTVGFLAILALPLRMGEFVRPYLIARPPKLRMSHGLGTMVVERTFDGLILSLLAFIAIYRAQQRTFVPRWILVAGYIVASLFVAALIVVILALWQRQRAVTLCRRLFGLFSVRLADRAAGLAAGVVDGFRSLPDYRRFFPFIAATLAYWFLNILAIYYLAFSFHFDLGLEGSMGFNALVGIGIMIPGGPGFAGNFEKFAAGALILYLPHAMRVKWGAAFILTAHVTNALWYIGTGVIALFSPEIKARKVWKAATDGQAPEEPTARGTRGSQKLDTVGSTVDARKSSSLTD